MRRNSGDDGGGDEMQIDSKTDDDGQRNADSPFIESICFDPSDESEGSEDCDLKENAADIVDEGGDLIVVSTSIWESPTT